MTTPIKTFFCKRHVARGDVLLTTPVLRALDNLHPGCRVYYETHHPEILARNPIVAKLNGSWVKPMEPVDMQQPIHIDLGIRYEKHPNLHIIDLFAMGAGFPPGKIKRKLEMYPSERDHSEAARLLPSGHKYVALAPGPGMWTGRNWDERNWIKLSEFIRSDEHKVVLTGSEMNYNIPCDIDLRGKTTYHTLAAVYKRCVLFVGIDSFPLHVAGAMNCPRVGLFGITLHQRIVCDSPNTVSIQSDHRHAVTGIRHRVSSMYKVEPLARVSNPMDTISIEEVAATVEVMLK